MIISPMLFALIVILIHYQPFDFIDFLVEHCMQFDLWNCAHAYGLHFTKTKYTYKSYKSDAMMYFAAVTAYVSVFDRFFCVCGFLHRYYILKCLKLSAQMN